MLVRAIYISPGHNFFGAYGSPPGTHETLSVSEVECVAGRGLRDDRFFDYKENYKGQVTFFAEEVHEALCDALSVHDKPGSAYRRNILTRDVDLNTLIACEFEVQGVRFLGASECSPCQWMDQALAPGAEAFLKGRGGLRARILTSGTLRVDT
jgi:MOSC domain-containing protein YiiM